MEKVTLSAENIIFEYSKEKRVLNEISFRAREGEFVGITGLSGSGKTTLLHCISGVIPHVVHGHLSGEIRIKDEKIEKNSLSQLLQRVGIVFQDPDNRMVATTVEDEIAFSLENLCLPPEEIRRRVDEILDLFRMRDLRKRKPESLSGGEKQLLAVASVLASDPPVIVMDEPMSHLDADGRTLVLELIGQMRQMGKTILVAEHNFYHLDGADRILFLEDGAIEREDRPSVMIPFLEEYFSEGQEEAELSDPLAKGQEEAGLSDPLAKEQDKTGLKGPLPKDAQWGPRRRHTSTVQGNGAISVQHLTFCYMPDQPVIDDFSAVFPSGAITAVTGKNGCGKSTLMKNITGILRPQSGKITVDGKDLTGLTIAQIAEKIGFVMQNPECQVLGMTVREEMEIGLRNRGVPDDIVQTRVERYLEYFELSQYAETFPGHLSTGEKQRLGIAATLAVGADFLILDEPSASLDMRRKNRLGILLRSLRNDGKGIILISHDERFNEMYADRTIHMERSGGR